MDGHGLKGVVLNDQPGKPLAVCLCGEISGGVHGKTWNITVSADQKTATISPSLDWPGHFHTGNPAVDCPVIEFGE